MFFFTKYLTNRLNNSIILTRSLLVVYYLVKIFPNPVNHVRNKYGLLRLFIETSTIKSRSAKLRPASTFQNLKVTFRQFSADGLGSQSAQASLIISDQFGTICSLLSFDEIDILLLLHESSILNVIFFTKLPNSNCKITRGRIKNRVLK